MAATVASLPIPPTNDATAVPGVNPAEARKRRREILALHRNSVASPDVAASSVIVADGETTPPTKRRKVITANACDLPAVVSPPTPVRKQVVSKTTGKPKKPQMKYDPDVPMTKEEAAAWRREQRRKRNRESAAASRQRQRDRIVELEAEVEGWKVKFDEAMRRIQELEQAPATNSGNSPVPHEEGNDDVDGPEVSMEDEGINIQSPEELVEEVFKDTTILISPSHSPRSVSPTSSTTVDFSQVQAVKVVSNVGASSVSSKEEQTEEEPQPPKMISRQA